MNIDKLHNSIVMSRALRMWFCFLSLLLILTNCRKDKWEEYYGRPDDLAKSMYYVLQDKDSFSMFLKCVDSSDFVGAYKGQGYYTLFAPNDVAFQDFLSENNYGTIDEFITQHPDIVEQIVSYSLVYNAYTIERLADYQSSKTGWVDNEGFKRRTAYFKGAYTDSRYKYKDLLSDKNNQYGYLIVDCNRNNIDASTDLLKTNGDFEINDNSYKHIPYFLNDYVLESSLSKPDYDCSLLFNRNYTKKNIAGASIIEEDIPAENGYIHVVDKVILPYKNLDEYLSSMPELSMFKSLLDTFAIFTENNEKETRIARITPSKAGVRVYVKRYDTDGYRSLYPYKGPSLFSRIIFSPNNESWSKAEDNDAQKNGWTLFAPTNEAMTDFYTNQLLKADGTRYSSLSSVPIPILTDFVNAHMIGQMVWPEKITSTSNSFSETVDASSIAQYKMASNGVLYVLNKAIPTKRLYSVFGDVYLNPNMSMYFYQITNNSLHAALSNLNKRYIFFLNSNNLFNFFLFNWNYNKNIFSSQPFDTKKMYVLTSYMSSFINLNTIVVDPTLRSDAYNLFKNDERIYKTLDENYLICRKGDPLAGYDSIIFSAGNTDSVSLPGKTWAVRVGNRHDALNGVSYQVASPDAGKTELTTFGEKWCMLRPCGKDPKCGITIRKYFYDNIYARYDMGKKFYNSTYTSKDLSANYCNTYYPRIDLRRGDTLFYAYLAKSGLLNESGEVVGLGNSGLACRTVLIPLGDSIMKYVDPQDTITHAKKLLPLLYDSVTTEARTLSDSDVRRIKAFIQYHIIATGIVKDQSTDPAEKYETLLLNTTYAVVANNASYSIPGNRTVKVVENIESSSLWNPSVAGSDKLVFQDQLGRKVKIIPNNSHILGERIVIHQINGILHY
jgi:uncharacterized surface protein with fasciclin (FAS1) repeats